MNMFYMLTSDGLSVTFTGKKTFMVAKDHPCFKQALEAVNAKQKPSFEEFEKIVDLKKNISKLSYEGVEISLNKAEELEVFVNGKKISNLAPALISRLIEMLKMPESDELREPIYQGFAKFLKNLYQNPSYRSVRQLYGFLDANDLPITQNGTFLAYKKIRSDYKDIHSGTFDNSVGKTVEMPRFEVEDNPEVTCSSGLHVCSKSYLGCFGSYQPDLDRIVICEVNPADVVSVPTDYHNAKMRVCKYTVIDEMPNHFEAQLASYLYGDHENGWINDTFQKLEKLYKDFFGVETVEFSQLPGTIRMTPAVVTSFYEDAEKVLGEIPAKIKEISVEKESVPTMKVLFQWLSKYDTNWKRPNAEADADADADAEVEAKDAE